MFKIKTDINGSYQDYFDKDLSFRDPDLYKSIKLELQATTAYRTYCI